MADGQDNTVTHASLAKSLKVTVTTIKSYRRKFPEFWMRPSLGKPLRFPAESLGLCKRIHEHFKRGFSVEETRKRLAEEFPVIEKILVSSPHTVEAPGQSSDSLSRMEGLLEGLFTLQNRTHSLLAELVAKLDTLAGVLGENPAARPLPVHRAVNGLPAGRATASSGIIPANPQNGVSSGAPGRPPQSLMDMPVVIRSETGEHLGVTLKSGRTLTLNQLESYLARQAGTTGTASPAWTPHGQEWILRVDSSGGTRECHFIQAVTPRGNTVARFVSCQVQGTALPESELQEFLRSVKEHFDQ